MIWLRFLAMALATLVWHGFASAQDVPAAARERVLVVGTKEAPPFAMKEPDGTWTGLSIELWQRIASDLGLRYRLEETTLQGLIDGTANDKLDAAVAALTVTSGRERVVDFTQPFHTTGLGIAVPRYAKFDWLRLVSSLVSAGFLEALAALFGLTMLVGVVVWLLERRHTEHFSGGRQGFMTGIWWSALTLAQNPSHDAPATLAGRIVAGLWISASLAVIAVFTAGVTSQFTTRQLQGVVHSVADLAHARVGGVQGTASLDYLTRRRIRYRVVASPEAGMEALGRGEFDALVYDQPILDWLARTRFGNTVNVLDVTFDRQNYAIALPTGSKLREPINVVMMDLIRTAWWEDLTTKYLGHE